MRKKTNATPVVDKRTKYVIERNEVHAASQAASNKRRIERNAPRREDMSRAAYYAFLMFYEEAAVEDRASFRNPFINILDRAGYSREACEAAFASNVKNLLDDLDAWMAQRWYAEKRRLGDDRGRYVSLKQVRKDVELVRSKALSPFLDQASSTEGSSAAD